MAPSMTVAPAKSPAESPYKLEPSQVLKASEALLQHMRQLRKEKKSSSGKKNLLAAGDDSDEEEAADSGEAEPVWLIITTKKHVADQKSLKPKRIALPHTLNVASAVSSICVITPNPQRAFKDVLENPLFPKDLAAKIRIRGVDKIREKFKSFEQRRQLRDEHDVFLADDRIITMLPKMIGKVLYDSTAKRPLPVNLSAPRPKDANGKTIKAEKKILSNKRIKGQNEDDNSVASPEAFAREVERALSSAQVHLSPSVTTAVRIGFSTFTTQQVAENIEAVVQGMVENIIPRKWRNVKSIHIKGPNTTSLPVWLASELWLQEEEVLEDEDAEAAKTLDSQKGRKRKVQEEDGKDDKKQKTVQAGISKGKDAGFSKEMTERREKLRQQKRQAKELVAAGA